MNTGKQAQRSGKARKRPGAWVITLDDASWAQLMVALGVAIDHGGDEDYAARWRTLRTALSQAEPPENEGKQ